MCFNKKEARDSSTAPAQSFLRPLLQDFHLSRFLGSSVYLPLCPFTQLPVLWTAAFGLLFPVLAVLTITVYILWLVPRVNFMTVCWW